MVWLVWFVPTDADDKSDVKEQNERASWGRNDAERFRNIGPFAEHRFPPLQAARWPSRSEASPLSLAVLPSEIQPIMPIYSCKWLLSACHCARHSSKWNGRGATIEDSAPTNLVRKSQLLAHCTVSALIEMSAIEMSYTRRQSGGGQATWNAWPKASWLSLTLIIQYIDMNLDLSFIYICYAKREVDKHMHTKGLGHNFAQFQLPLHSFRDTNAASQGPLANLVPTAQAHRRSLPNSVHCWSFPSRSI